jgi:hypothetical protein
MQVWLPVPRRGSSAAIGSDARGGTIRPLHDRVKAIARMPAVANVRESAFLAVSRTACTRPSWRTRSAAFSPLLKKGERLSRPLALEPRSNRTLEPRTNRGLKDALALCNHNGSALLRPRPTTHQPRRRRESSRRCKDLRGALERFSCMPSAHVFGVRE